MDDDACSGLGTLIGHGHVGNERQVGDGHHIVVTLNLIAKQTQQVDDAERQQQTKHDTGQEDDRRLRADLTHIQRLVDELSLIGGSSQRDGILLTLL